jgi:hypothetical protein
MTVIVSRQKEILRMAGEPYRVTCNGVNMIHLGLALATFDVC